MASASDHAALLIAAGYRVWPIDSRSKQPTRSGFARSAGPYVTARPEDFPYGTEVGVLCGPCPIAGGGRLVCVDLDGPVPEDALPRWPGTLTSKCSAHRWYIVDGASAFRQTAGILRGDGWAVDTRDYGGYARETTGGVGLWDMNPTTTDIARLTEAQVAEMFPTSGPVPTPSVPVPAGLEPWRRDSLVRAFAAGPNTNYLAGGVGRVLHQHAGWTPEAVREYVYGILTGLGHPDASRHADTAARAATAESRAWGIPRLVTAGVEMVTAPAPDVPGEDVSAVLLAGGDPDSPFASHRLTSAADIAAWDPPPIPWLVEALAIAPGAPALVTGYGGSGKTTFVQHLAIAVATAGARLLGEFPVRHGSVLHVDHEQGLDLTKRRYRRLGISAAAQLDLVSFPRWALGDPSSEARGAFLEACRGRALVIIDSLLASTAGWLEDGENSSSAREPLDFLTYVSGETGACVLVIHHSKKDRSDRMTSARGTSAITDAVSVHLTFERADMGHDTRPVLALGKVRNEHSNGMLTGDVEVRMQLRGPAADEGYTLIAVDPAEAEASRAEGLRERIIELFVAGHTGSANSVVQELSSARQDTLAIVKDLVDDGTLTRTGGVVRLSP